MLIFLVVILGVHQNIHNKNNYEIIYAILEHLFIKFINTVGKFINLKDIITNSKCPYVVLKIVLGISYSTILT